MGKKKIEAVKAAKVTTKTEYLVKKDRIIEAAGDCDDARKVLKKLFPEAFESELVLRCLKVGDRFKLNGTKYMLCHHDGEDMWMGIAMDGANVGEVVYCGDDEDIYCAVSDLIDELEIYPKYQEASRKQYKMTLNQYQLSILLEIDIEEALKVIIQSEGCVV